MLRTSIHKRRSSVPVWILMRDKKDTVRLRRQLGAQGWKVRLLRDLPECFGCSHGRKRLSRGRPGRSLSTRAYGPTRPITPLATRLWRFKRARPLAWCWGSQCPRARRAPLGFHTSPSSSRPTGASHVPEHCEGAARGLRGGREGGVPQWGTPGVDCA